MTTALEGLPDNLPDDAGGLRAAVLAMRAELAAERVELAAERAERQRLEDQNERIISDSRGRCTHSGEIFGLARSCRRAGRRPG
jgi:hypothetical protein